MTITTKREDLILRLNNERRVLAAAEKLRRESTRGKVILTAAAQTRAALEVAEMQDAIRETERTIALWDKIVNDRIEEVKTVKKSIVSAKSCLKEIESIVNDVSIDNDNSDGSTKDRIRRIVDLVNQFTYANDGSYVDVNADDIVRTVWPLFEEGTGDSSILRGCGFRIMRTWIKGKVNFGDDEIEVDINGLFWRWWWKWRNEPRYKWLFCIYESFGIKEDNDRFGLGEGEWEPLVIWIIRGIVRQEVECLQFVRSILQNCGEIGSILLTPIVFRGIICMSESGYINGIEMNLLYIMCCNDAILYACKFSARCGIVDYIVKTVLDPNYGGISIPILIKLFESEGEIKKFVINSGLIPLLLTSLLENNENEEDKNNRIRRHSAKIIMSLLSSSGGIGAFNDNNLIHLKTLISGLNNEKNNIRYIVLAIICGSLGIHKPNILIGGDGIHPEIFLWEKIEFGEFEDYGGPPGRANPEIGGIIRRVCEIELIEMYMKCELIKILIEQFEKCKEDNLDSRWFAFAISEIIYLIDYYGIKKNFERISFRLNRFIEREIRKHYRLIERGRLKLQVKINKDLEDNYFLKIIKGYKYKIEENNEEINLYDEPIDFDNKKLNLKINEEYINNLILKSNVLTTKEFNEWNWVIIEEIFGNYFCFNKILEEEIIKGNKFIKRIISFFKPQKAGFITLKGFKKNEYLIEIGNLIIKDLSNSKLGIKLLRESLIIPTIIASIELYIEGNYEEIILMGNNTLNEEEIEEIEGIEGINFKKLKGIFTRDRLNNSPVSGYIRMICTLTELPLGVKLLEEFGGIGILFKLINLRNDEGKLSNLARDFISPRISGILRIGIEKNGYLNNLINYNDDYSLIKWVERIRLEMSLKNSSSNTKKRSKVVSENACTFGICIAREMYAVSRGLAISTMVDKGNVNASIGVGGAITIGVAANANTSSSNSTTVMISAIDATMRREELIGCLYGVAGGIVSGGEEAVFALGGASRALGGGALGGGAGGAGGGISGVLVQCAMRAAQQGDWVLARAVRVVVETLKVHGGSLGGLIAGEVGEARGKASEARGKAKAGGMGGMSGYPDSETDVGLGMEAGGSCGEGGRAVLLVGSGAVRGKSGVHHLQRV